MILQLGKHCHHNRLFEPVWDFEERVAYIKEEKPQEEQPLRLRLFQIVPDELIPGKDSPEWLAANQTSEAYNQAWEASQQAGEASDQAWRAYTQAEQADKQAWGKSYAQVRGSYYQAEGASQKAWGASQKALRAYQKAFGEELNELHKKLCPDCPWNGETIFTRKDKDGVWY